mgnify:CR=1 FL=1
MLLLLLVLLVMSTTSHGMGRADCNIASRHGRVVLSGLMRALPRLVGLSDGRPCITAKNRGRARVIL